MNGAAPLSPVRTVVAISDFCDGWPPADSARTLADSVAAWREGRRGPPPALPAPNAADVEVKGGYLQRLPLSLVASGLVERAEIWHHWRADTPPPYLPGGYGGPARRAFHLDAPNAPFRSADMAGFMHAFGAPQILCVWGLGVDESVLAAAADSFKIYNSIDAPALRIAPEISRHFDLVLTGAEWQSAEVEARHPGMPTLVLPVGPEFASPETFYPLGSEKPYDVVYVAAAQPYKRHDILFDGLASAPRPLRALCVFGYGEMADALRGEALARGLDVDFVGPPSVEYAEVNRLINLARIGVVCGVDDGAPAILTEYMLAGLPVLANADLRCGLQYILPQTGITAPAADFGGAMVRLVERAESLDPRSEVLARWSWPRSAERLIDAMRATSKGRRLWP